MRLILQVRHLRLDRLPQEAISEKVISSMKISLIDFFKLSKLHQDELSDLSICRHGSSVSTVSSGICILFKDKPELSVMWVVLGQPCSGIFTPIVVAIAELNLTGIEYWSDGEVWSNYESIRELFYGINGLYSEDVKTANDALNFTSSVEGLLVNYIMACGAFL